MKKETKPKKASKILKTLPKYPSLEHILWAMNGMKKNKVLLKKVKYDKNGRAVECFTKKGGVLYERMFELFRGMMTLAEIDRHEADRIFNVVKENLDCIASGGEI